MAQDRITELFFELFSGLPRQGPGDAASTLKALALIPGVGPATQILDLGCGTGLQTRVLAQHSPAHIVAVDSHEPFVRTLEQQVKGLGLEGRVEARVGDMRRLDFEPGSFDIIWSEGAINVLGFEAALREWRPLLVSGGYIAATEVCWTRSDPPPACAAFWAQEYPAIRTPGALLACVSESGYDPIGHFGLPSSAWWDDYYRPLQRNVTAFRRRYQGDSEAEGLAAQVQREIDIWHAYSGFYGYEFFVVRAR